MDEHELARRAVERRAISEEQLREARSFAEGGRSLLSVLLDLGYLRADDLPGLMDLPPPPRPRRRPLKWIAALGLLSGAAFLVGRGCADSSSPVAHAPNPIDTLLRLDNARLTEENETLRKSLRNPGQAAFEYLRVQALQGSADAEARLKADGHLTPEARGRFQQAAALLEAASASGRLGEGDFLALGRARETLVEWDLALEAYLRAARLNPRQAQALLGAARASLELGKNEDAHRHAQAAIARKPTAEAYLLRGRAAFQSGRKDEARRDFIEARKLDPSLAPAVANLLDRLSRE